MEISNIKEKIIESHSVSDLSKKIYGYTNKYTIDNINELIFKNNIDVSHFGKIHKNRKYIIIKKICPVCSSEFETQEGHVKEKVTCSIGCSNTYFRSNKSMEERKKISDSLNDYYEEIDKSSPFSNKNVTFKCVECYIQFNRKVLENGKLSRAKTCSDKCRSKLISKNSKKVALRRIAEGTHKGWSSRNIRSYPEEFFEEVLKNNNLFKSCIVEYRISKRDLGIDCNSNYFLDFYFPDIKLDLEIDGKQHNLKDRKLSDKNRDIALESNGIEVYRIKWKSINTKKGKLYIKKEINNFLEHYKSKMNKIKSKLRLVELNEYLSILEEMGDDSVMIGKRTLQEEIRKVKKEIIITESYIK